MFLVVTLNLIVSSEPKYTNLVTFESERDTSLQRRKHFYTFLKISTDNWICSVFQCGTQYDRFLQIMTNKTPLAFFTVSDLKKQIQNEEKICVQKKACNEADITQNPLQIKTSFR